MNPASAELTASLTTLRDFIRWGASRFAEAELDFGHGTASPLDEAAALTLHTLHLPYNLSEFYLQAALTPDEKEALVKVFDRRINERKPSAYITHDAIFAGLSFYVDERVLVPRSPIAELIEQRFEPWVDEVQVGRILDLCTGSGCIAIACAYAFPGAKVDAVELSEDALAVAEINIAKHQVEGQVNLYRSDLFEALPDGVRYDVIVSNPPYVSVAEWRQLPAEFHAEPEMGFVAGETGLDIVVRILAEAKQYIAPLGILIVEVGSSGETLQETFPDVPFYWLDFERGGDGVFLLTAEQVHEYHQDFMNVLS
jgi:ribosomal protein L3 glutamine methyltransferase